MTRTGVLRCGAAAVLFGISAPLASLLTDDMGAFTLAGLLYIGAAIAVIPFVGRTPPTRHAVRSSLPNLSCLPRVVWTVSTIQPNRSWTWHNRSPGATTLAHHTLAATSDGHTHVGLSIDQRGVVGRPVGWLLKRLTRRYLRLEAEGLRHRSEIAAAAPEQT